MSAQTQKVLSETGMIEQKRWQQKQLIERKKPVYAYCIKTQHPIPIPRR